MKEAPEQEPGQFREGLVKVVQLCLDLEAHQPLSQEQVAKRQKAWLSGAAEKMLSGATSNQAVGGPSVLNLDETDFRTLLRNKQHDLLFFAEQTRIWVDAHWRTGDIIAPYYPRRVAIILRKHNVYDLEIRFIGALSLHAPYVFPDRLAKALALAKKRNREI